MKVEQLMTRTVRVCHPDDSLNAAAQIMWEEDCGCVPVVVDGEKGQQVIAMLTDRDVCMAAYTQGRCLADITVRTAMSRDLVSCGMHEPVAVALKILVTNQIHRLPIVDDGGVLVGILSVCDLAREVTRERDQKRKALAPEQVGEAMQAIVERRGARTLMTAA